MKQVDHFRYYTYYRQIIEWDVGGLQKTLTTESYLEA